MKRIIMLVVVAAAAMLYGCGGSKTCTISGIVDEEQYNGRKIFLVIDTIIMDNNGRAILASYYCDSTIIENKHFSFTRPVSNPVIAKVETEGIGENERYMYLDFVAHPGNVSLLVTHEDSTDKVTGNWLNDRLSGYKADIRKLTSQVYRKDDPMLARYTTIDEQLQTGKIKEDQLDQKEVAELVAHYDSLVNIDREIHNELLWRLYHNNEDNLLGAYAIKEMRFYYDGRFLEKPFVDSLMNTASDTAKSFLKILSENIEFEKQYNEQMKKKQEATAGGKHYIDVPGVVKTMENGQWKERSGSLRDLIDGHVAVVDFWASWCGPCRQEIKETLLDIHEKYKDKGVVVVGLDVWDEINAHAKAVEQLGITYPQLIDTTKYSSDTYGVGGVPTIFVIDTNGVIIGRDLRGKFIEQAVVKALDNKSFYDAAIMLDDYRVMYMGIDNPVSIAVSNLPVENISLEVVEGEATIIPGDYPGSYNVRLASDQKSIILGISAFIDGEKRMVTKYKYMVRPLPIPILTINGIGSGAIIARKEISEGTIVKALSNPDFLMKIDRKYIKIVKMRVAVGSKEESIDGTIINASAASMIRKASKGEKLIIVADVMMPDRMIHQVTFVATLK